MTISFHPVHSTTLLVGGILSFYFALRGPACLSDVALTLSTLSACAENLHLALSSPPGRIPMQMSPEDLATAVTSIKSMNVSRDCRSTEHPILPNGVATAISSFEKYPLLASNAIQRKHGGYSKQSSKEKLISNKLGYSLHFEKARKGIEMNARLTGQVAQLGRELYNTGPEALENEAPVDFGLVDSAFGHLVRDWSTQGLNERRAVFPPILEALEQHFGLNSMNRKVLVPGCGMGRLASDIADAGYNVTANDLDYESILIYHLLANHTTSLHQHAIQPFVTKWAHQADSSSRYSAITVPDHMPNRTVELVEGDFLKVFPQDAEFDAVVTLFFIDMSDNVIDFLSNIHRLLKPGGIWINLGPLKWDGSSILQLSADEVLQLAELLGFDVNHESRKSIHSTYGAQPESLLRFTYVLDFDEEELR
ncbi:N2227-like protein-domain-containing protein [Bipolaris maydis]|nr:N2227-like protein-domain-containing protein [Bipolaris maydis]